MEPAHVEAIFAPSPTIRPAGRSSYGGGETPLSPRSSRRGTPPCSPTAQGRPPRRALLLPQAPELLLELGEALDLSQPRRAGG